jgi:uncharacterized membrane protein
MEEFNMSVTLRRLCMSAVIAALYAALTLAGAPLAYGPIQFRVSEFLCVLPFFAPFTSIALFAGCLLANLLSPAGIWDVVLGSLATLLAALCTAYFGKSWRKTGKFGVLPRIFACLMPALFNALIIGAMLAALFPLTGGFWTSFFIFGLQVGAGEAAVMLIIGFPCMSVLPKTRILQILKK